MTIDLRKLLDAGELHRIAVECKTQGEMARRLGLSPDTYEKRIKRIRGNGDHWPTLAELQMASGAANSAANGNDTCHDFDDEEPTLPGVPVLPSADNLPISGNFQPNEGIPDGHYIRGKSTLRDATGAVVMEWTKTSVSEQHYREALLVALSDPLTWLREQSAPIAAPAHADDDLLTVYGIGDAHLGMQAWWEETGENFDLEIAIRDLHAAIDTLVSLAPPSKRAIVLSVGDLVHFDNESKTTTAGTRQDADTRWSKVMRAAISTGRHCTDRALTKHELVDDYFLSGNHDRHTSMAISLALDAFYSADPRVTVSTSPNPFQFIRFGKVLLGLTHGDEAKADKLPSIMACDRAADWGETLHREWLTGHVHHLSTKEYPGCVVKTLRTLATSDRWHHGSGYRSGHEMVAMTYHREWGLIDTRTVGIRQLRARRAG